MVFSGLDFKHTILLIGISLLIFVTSIRTLYLFCTKLCYITKLLCPITETRNYQKRWCYKTKANQTNNNVKLAKETIQVSEPFKTLNLFKILNSFKPDHLSLSRLSATRTQWMLQTGRNERGKETKAFGAKITAKSQTASSRWT